MQTEAEKYLIALIDGFLKDFPGRALIMDLGAADSLVVEEALNRRGRNFICDRSDLVASDVKAPYIGERFVCPAEKMDAIKSDNYDLVFANFVMEHVQIPDMAAAEMSRILKPGGRLVLSLSNPKALEFILARLTPTSFHQIFRQKGHDKAHPTIYAYKSIKNFIKILEKNGFKLIEERSFPATYSYLHPFPILNIFSWLYDHILIFLKLKILMGHSVIVLSK